MWNTHTMNNENGELGRLSRKMRYPKAALVRGRLNVGATSLNRSMIGTS